LITLYVDGYFVNQFDATVMIALEEKRIPYTTARALLRDGGGVPPALSGKTGIARVPAIQHGDFWLTESLAIVEYLDETFGAPLLLPQAPRARARTRQLMAFVRFDLIEVREERPWWMCVYPSHALPAPALSTTAERDVRELFALVSHLEAAGELAVWNIAHADLALLLLRLARTEYTLIDPAQRLLDRCLERPSVRAYVDHARPPNPPPRPLAKG
jgi:glutathione S-transferase